MVIDHTPKFESIWLDFDYIIEEMKAGMCFFEGFIQIPSLISESDFYQILKKLSLQSVTTFSCQYSTWYDNSTSNDLDKTYKLHEYVHMFFSETLLTLHFDYSYTVNDTDFFQKLMFDKYSTGFSLEIICYREAILNADNPKYAIRDAISEFYSLHQKFNGKNLFIGPDTTDCPKSSNDYPNCWIKLI